MREALLDVLRWTAVFNHGLTASEVRRYAAVEAGDAVVEATLQRLPEADFTSGRWHLSDHPLDPDRVEAAQQRAKAHLEESSSALATLCSSTAVLGVAVTGSVAAGVNNEDGDLDLLIIARPGHVWRVRALAIYLEHHHPGGWRLCPNMVLDARDLTLRPSIYAAREMSMLRPLKGRRWFEALRTANPWVSEFLPNSDLAPDLQVEGEAGAVPSWWTLMRMPVVGRVIERWERQRRIAELQQASTSHEAVYAARRCLGHENAHRTRIEERMADLQHGGGVDA
jgi:predicted nucleotidyltransferase